jgi:23S rRNA (guanine745-N1)-methyltransferase
MPLEPHAGAFVCPRGHRFDIARSGYVNLLQPQDRRSRSAGDSASALDARARLLEAQVGLDMFQEFVATAAAYASGTTAVVAELGCGTGDALASLARARPITGLGIDLSAAAIDRAARRFPRLTWVVANADRRLPVLGGTVDLVISLHGRQNPAECARILVPGGVVVLGVAGKDDLVELRTDVQGRALPRDRVATASREHERAFRVVERRSFRSRAHLSPQAQRDLLRGTYRGARRSAAVRVDTLAAKDVTLALEVIVLARR